jgi:hypothetical protein
MGEELCIAIRSYTRGWDIYAPNEMVIWHFYTRADRPKVWKDDAARTEKWSEIEKQSYAIQKDILLGKEDGVFGIGDWERYLSYQKMIGINFSEFYGKDLEKIINDNVLVEELNFADTGKRSAICIKEQHKTCIARNCECRCHKGWIWN